VCRLNELWGEYGLGILSAPPGISEDRHPVFLIH
jgi:hypothetical protein